MSMPKASNKSVRVYGFPFPNLPTVPEDDPFIKGRNKRGIFVSPETRGSKSTPTHPIAVGPLACATFSTKVIVRGSLRADEISWGVI